VTQRRESTKVVSGAGAANACYCARVIRPSIVSGVLTLALTTSACRSPESAPEGAAEASPAGKADDADDADDAEEVTPTEVEAPTAAVPVMAEPTVEYAAALDPLLDLVPGEDDHFIVLRDPTAVLKLFDAFVGAATPSVLGRFSDQPKVAEARVVLEEVAALRDALIAAKVDVDKGMVFLEGPGALVYGTASEDPTALKVALKAVGVKDSDLPPTCVAPPAMPGFAACGDDEATLKALTPGKHGAAFRSGFEGALTGFELERGNALFRLKGPDGPVLGAVATPPGRLHVVVGLADVAAEIGKYVGSGRPDALGMLSPGAAFIWGRVELAPFKDQIDQSPPPVKNVAGTLTGEVLVGGVESSAGAVLVGVDDPFPASGLVSLAALQTEMIQSQLPEGSTVKVEAVDAGGSKTQALHVTMAVDAQSQKMVDALGLEPSAWGFAAGKYAGAVLGAKVDAVQAVAAYEPGDVALDGVPGNLAKALRSGDVGFAFYLPFDALQAATIRDTLQAAITAAPGAEVADPKMIEAAYDILSPLSSIAVWLTHPADHRVLHVSIDSFADATTDEGKDALEALGKVIAGADPSETYGALAAKYPSSPRTLRYRVRAGDVEGGVGPTAMSASFLLGALAGITIPAFTKYMERARAAEAELSAAERALMDAQWALEQAP